MVADHGLSDGQGRRQRSPLPLHRVGGRYLTAQPRRRLCGSTHSDADAVPAARSDQIEGEPGDKSRHPDRAAQQPPARRYAEQPGALLGLAGDGHRDQRDRHRQRQGSELGLCRHRGDRTGHTLSRAALLRSAEPVRRGRAHMRGKPVRTPDQSHHESAPRIRRALRGGGGGAAEHSDAEPDSDRSERRAQRRGTAYSTW